MQVGGDRDGAVKKFEEALVTAKTIENTGKMEWKLQSATTKLKIASVLLTENPRPLTARIEITRRRSRGNRPSLPTTRPTTSCDQICIGL